MFSNIEKGLLVGESTLSIFLLSGLGVVALDDLDIHTILHTPDPGI